MLKEGKDVLLIAVGATVQPSLEAARRLEEQGIKAAVMNARFIKPLDRDLILEWARKTNRVVTIEENVLQGGFGSGVLELFQEAGFFPSSMLRLGLPDEFIPQGGQGVLRSLYGIDADGIERGVLSLLQTHHGQLRAIGQTARR
jgi:1-deoxy-D-xylulose-5-phosphate synthase